MEKEIPIWISDYVLASYGTGAIMAVPAHDTQTMNLPRNLVLRSFRIRRWKY